MPTAPSEEFLLWHETVVNRSWRKFLRKKLTRTRWIVFWMLQAYPDYKPGITDDPLAAAKQALADGWGQ